MIEWQALLLFPVSVIMKTGVASNHIQIFGLILHFIF